MLGGPTKHHRAGAELGVDEGSATSLEPGVPDAQAQAVPPEVQAELAQLRSRVDEGEEWQRRRDTELELLRNALRRRDALLVGQRSAFYRELFTHQGYANIASVAKPSSTLEEMLGLERLATAGRKAAERPAFFDARVFEAAHLEVDEPLAKKVAAALAVRA